MIQILNIRKNFDKLQLSYPNIKISKGQLALVCGNSGKGKSTLCEIISGFMIANSGKIIIDSQIILDCTQQNKNLNSNIFSYIHYIAQFPDFNLIGPTCLSELLFWKFNTNQDNDLNDKIKEYLIYFNLINMDNDLSILDKPIWKLSFGKKKALSFCALMLIPRPIWILDEPFTGLDLTLKNKLIEAMRTFLNGNGMILATSHNAEDYKIFNPIIYNLE